METFSNNSRDAPIFNKTNDVVVSKETADKVNEILIGNVPKEKVSDSMTISSNPFRVEWRPNNYRRYLKVRLKSDSTKKVLSSVFGSDKLQGKTFYDKTFAAGVTLQYGRDTLVAMYSQKYVDGVKEVFVVEDEDFNTYKQID